MSKTILQLLNLTTDFFKKRGIPSARLDAEILLGHALKYSRIQLYTRFDQPVSQQELDDFRDLVTRRASREPVAYIVGQKEFWGLELVVGQGVLIPRPDTERLVEEGIKLLGPLPKQHITRKTLPWRLEPLMPPGQETELPVIQTAPEETSPAAATPQETAPTPTPTAQPVPPLLLDLCTGTGAIAIAIAKDTGARAIGVDISVEALDFARQNVERHLASDQMALLQGDLCAPIPARFRGRFDLVTSNPPYLSATVMEGLEPEITQFEPRLALESSPNPHLFYQRIADELPKLLKPGGWTLLEVGDAEQGDVVKGMLEKAGLKDVSLLLDLGGLVRVVKGQWRP